MIAHTFPEAPDFLKPLVSLDGGYPKDEIDEVIRRRVEATPHLLAAVEWMVLNPGDAIETNEYMLPFYALYLLALFREKQAADLVVALARHPLSDGMIGDVITEGLHAILASLCMNNPESLNTIIEDSDADPFARASALDALATLCLKDKLPRETLCQYLLELYETKLEKKPSFVWDGAVGVSVDLGFSEHLELIQRAYAEGLADDTVDLLEDVLSKLNDGGPWNGNDRRYRFVNSVDGEISHWYCFSEKYQARRDAAIKNDIEEEDDQYYPGFSHYDGISTQIYRRPGPKIGRNDPCPCGSGKKYKKYCGG
ncbi:MAG: DUF1186 domain-containing protein [Verrucomicrobia bacterium]|nr:DUF1186 domain-containing protein [Verrucomicrobiota bacterium]